MASTIRKQLTNDTHVTPATVIFIVILTYLQFTYSCIPWCIRFCMIYIRCVKFIVSYIGLLYT